MAHLRIALLCMVLALGLARPAWAVFLFPIEGKLGLLNGANNQRNSEDNLKSSGSEVELSLAPVWAQRGKSGLRFTPTYDLDYNSVGTVLRVEEELFLFTQQMTNAVTLGGGYKTSADTRFGVKAFYEAFNGKVATDEPWTYGLYDYQDLGADLNWSAKWALRVPTRTTLGLRGTQRKYPHYVSLDAEERHEKDSNLGRAYFNLEFVWNTQTPVFTLISVSNESSSYAQSLIVDATGTTNSGERRRDSVTNFSISLPIEGEKQSWDLAYDLESRDSNLNYFDSQDLTYIPDYNDYAEHAFVLSFGYNFDGPWWVLKKPQLTLGASATARVYAQRLAKNDKGEYTTAKEIDNTFGFDLGFNTPLASFLSAYLKVDFQGHRSNNADAGTSLANYNFTTTSLGTRFAV